MIPDNFDRNLEKVCSNGIHYFLKLLPLRKLYSVYFTFNYYFKKANLSESNMASSKDLVEKIKSLLEEFGTLQKC